MKITLYKDCVVRDTYSRVFSPTVFEDYLATLTKTEFDIDSSYAIMGGSFSFDWGIVNAASPYVYNYMKIDDDDNDIMFYAFINRVDLANGCVVINYSNDIWHTFIGGCRMYDSLVNQSKHAPAGKYHFLPIDYLTNDKLKWVSLDPEIVEGEAEFNDRLCPIIEIQFYRTKSSDGYGANRIPMICLLDCVQSKQGNRIFSFSNAKDVMSAITSLSINQGTTKYTIVEDSLRTVPSDYTDYYFDIVNVYLVRESWLYNLKTLYFDQVRATKEPIGHFVPSQLDLGLGEEVTKNLVSVYPVVFRKSELLPDETHYKYEYPTGELITLKSYGSYNNFKNVAAGVYTNPVKAQNNGTESQIRLYGSVNDYGFHFFLGIYGQVFEITEFLKLEVPFNSINGETTQLRAIADLDKRDKAIANILNKSVEAYGSLIKGALGTSEGTAFSTKASKIGSFIQGLGKYANTISNSVIDIRNATASKYQTNYAQDLASNAMLNAWQGLGIFRVETVDNQEEVNFAIDNYGYTMGVVPTTDLPYNPFNLESGYNPTSYSQINLFGSCPQSTLNQLEEILTKGTKIYYSLEEVNGTTN